MTTDIVGYTRLMEADEQETHDRFGLLRMSIIEPLISRVGGKIIKNTGDGFIAIFDEASQALDAAHCMQQDLVGAERQRSPERRLLFRIGLHESEVIVEHDDVFGDGVNVAARLQTHAEPGGIVISGLLEPALDESLDVHRIDLGQMTLRNRSEPVRVISLRLPGAPAQMVGETAPGGDWRPSIAVLPFRKLATPEVDGYFADGIVDNIIYALGGLSSLFVIARGSTTQYREAVVDAREVGETLGVRYMLHGSVQQSGDALRIVTELTDTGSAKVIRTDRYDGVRGDLFRLQDEIAEAVAKTIAPQVRDRELKRAQRKHPQNMNAYDLVLQALDKLDRLEIDVFADARGLLQKAMTLDPSYAPAYSYAAWWHSYRIGQEWSTDVAADSREALRLARAALECDENDALALTLFGHECSFLLKDYELALEHFDRAVAVCPNMAMAWTIRGATYCYIGDGPSALDCAMKGVRLSPIDQHVYFAEHIVAQAHYVNGAFEEALAWSRRADKHNSRLTSNLRTLIACLVATGRDDEARMQAQRHMQLSPHFSVSRWEARTPMVPEVSRPRVEMLRYAGLPE